MKVLITGGAGFIGSNLARNCLKNGYQTRIIDNLSTGKLINIKDILNQVNFVAGDINDKKSLNKIISGVDIVFHVAALPSVIRSFHEPLKVHENNINGTLNVLLAAKEAGVKKFVYSASSSAYGDQEVLPKREDQLPKPISNYAVSKLTGEYYCQVFNRLYGLETISLRYFNVFGQYQDVNSEYAAVIPKFINSAINNEKITIYGDGQQTRDFTFIENIIEANLLAANASKEASGLVYNIGCGERISLLEVITAIEKILDKTITKEFLPVRLGDVKHSLADITLAKNNLKYQPKINFMVGLEKTIKWYQQQK